MRAADDRRGAAPGGLRQGICAGGGAVRPRAGQDPGLPHQPRGVPGGGPGQAGHPGPRLRRPGPGGRAGRLHRPGRGGITGRAGPAGAGYGPGRPEIPAKLLPGLGAAGPHHHRGAGGGHLLVRPLPPHHLLHPLERRRNRGPCRQARVLPLPEAAKRGLRREGKGPA